MLHRNTRCSGYYFLFIIFFCNPQYWNNWYPWSEVHRHFNNIFSVEFSIQNRIRTTEGQERAQNLERLEKLKAHLSELEKQYEKSKPLVNLVDNMVKLGSLYRGGNNQRYTNETSTLDRLEFNQRVQERRLLQEEQRQWERMSPNQSELQVKLFFIYKKII